MTPIRSPAETVSETPSNRGLSGRVIVSSTASIKITPEPYRRRFLDIPRHGLIPPRSSKPDRHTGSVNSVPPLHPKLPGLGLRAISLAVPGIRKVSAQIEPYTKWWSDQNQTALHQTERPLLAVIGDSTAIGIGASAPDNGYIGVVIQALSKRDDVPWRAINLAQSGARVADGIERQLPIIDDLQQSHSVPSIVICSIGSNDVVWSRDTGALRDRLRTLIADLPETAVVAQVAGESPRARLANRTIKGAAAERGLGVVNPWGEPGPPYHDRLSEDRFHPSDLGHRLMARPFARSFNAPEPTAG